MNKKMFKNEKVLKMISNPPVVRLCDGVELLLARGIPQHQPDVLSVDSEVQGGQVSHR